jgi:serine/threonine-protein kinase
MHPAPGPDLIRSHVEKIVRNRAFAQSERMRRFLRFTVDYCLNQRGEDLKEYLIGVEVFDKRADYDPRLDPIVRVEARRLRSKLKEYYETEGRNDELVIEFPKGGYVPHFRHRRAVTPPRPDTRASAMAVLPFTNLGPAPDQDYFADGLAEELIHGLTRIRGLRVVAWRSAAQLREKQDDLAAIGDQLKVGSVITGSVRRVANRVRVTVQLVETATGVYLWSDTYDRELQDVFLMQEDISRAVVGALRIQLGRESGGATRPLRNVEAHNFYLQGRHHWNKRTPEGLRKSIQLFEQAVALDPEFGLGFAGLADAYALLADYGLFSPTEMVPKAKAAAMRAIEVEPGLGEAWASLALICGLNDWEWDEAIRDYERAIELNPGYATAHHWYAVDCLALLGRTDEALHEIEIAHQLDPLSPMINEGKGYIRLLRREYDLAMRHHYESLDLDPFFYKSFSAIGRTYIQRGMYAEAIEMFKRAQSLAGEIPNLLSALAQAHALAGDRDTARRILQQLHELARQRYVSPTCFAVVHLGLGENERALWLESACAERATPLAAVGVHPLYDPLRSDPRFKALLRRIRLAE